MANDTQRQRLKKNGQVAELVDATTSVKMGQRMKAQVVYCGSEWDKMKPYFAEPLKELTQAANTKGEENRFNKIRFDIEAIDALKVPNYNPFVVKTYETQIIDNRLTLVQVPNQQ